MQNYVTEKFKKENHTRNVISVSIKFNGNPKFQKIRETSG